MDFDTWLIYLLAAFGLSLSPGPNGLLALTHGALHGRRKAMFTVVGGAVGFVAVIALSMFGRIVRSPTRTWTRRAPI